jgi:hypothetical protein
MNEQDELRRRLDEEAHETADRHKKEFNRTMGVAILAAFVIGIFFPPLEILTFFLIVYYFVRSLGGFY